MNVQHEEHSGAFGKLFGHDDRFCVTTLGLVIIRAYLFGTCIASYAAFGNWITQSS
jgi:hypothetical protein